MSLFSFLDDNLSNSSKLGVCIDILRRSGLGLLMDKFCQFLIEFSVRYMSDFSFPDNNLSK